MPLKSFEDSLKDHAEKFSPAVAPNNWDAIASALPAEKQKKRVVWLWLSAACLTLAGFISLLNYRSAKSTVTDKTATTIQNTQISATFTSDTVIKAKVPNTSAIIIPDIYAPQRTLIKAPVPVIRKTERIIANRVFVYNDPIETIVPELTAPIPEPEYELVIADTTPDKKRDTGILLTKSKIELKKAQSRELKHSLGIELAGIVTDTRTKVTKDNLAAFNGPMPIVNQYDYLRNETDKSVLGFYAGLTYTLQRKQGSIKTGLFYQQINYALQVNNTNINSLSSGGRISNFDYNSSDSFVAGEAGTVRNSYTYLRIPLEYWRENFSLNRWHFQYGGGLATHFYLRHQGLSNQPSGLYVKSDLSDKSVIHKMHTSLNLGMGLSYSIGQRSRININALYSRSLSPIESATVITNYQTIGISTGIYFLLN